MDGRCLYAPVGISEMKIFLHTLVMCGLAFGEAAAHQLATARNWGHPVGRLEMSVSRDSSAGGLSRDRQFQVELRNAGRSELQLDIGEITPLTKYPEKIHFTLTDPQGKSREIGFPMLGGIAGTPPIPFLVLLRPGDSLSLPVDLTKLFPYDGMPLLPLKPGTYTLRGEYTGQEFTRGKFPPRIYGYKFGLLWTGTVLSNTLRFTISAQSSRNIC